MQNENQRLEVLPSQRINAATAVERRKMVVARFEEAIADADEGIMLKQASSTYEFGVRSDKWLKLKPEYAEGAFDTLDLAIIAGYYGEGSVSCGVVL